MKYPRIPLAAHAASAALLALFAWPVQAAGYGLQVGQFAKEKDAYKLAERVTGQGLPARVLLVQREGKTWAVVAAGQFATPAEAQAQRATIASRLSLSQPP